MKYTDEDIARLASFPAQNPNPVIEADHEKGMINYMNPAAQKNFPDMLSKGFAHPLFDEIRKRLKLKKDFQCEVVLSKHTFEQKIFFIEGTHFIRVYSTDITEMKQVQKNLLRLASFPEQNPSPIVEIDMNMNITYYNPAVLLHFPDLISLNMEHPIFEDLKINFEKFRSGEWKVYSKEIRYGQKYYDQRARIMEDNNVIRMFNLDITKMKLTEEALTDRNKDITDSMHYALRIQKALMPTEKNIDKILKRLQKRENK